MGKPDTLSEEALQALRAGDQHAWKQFFDKHDSLILDIVSWSKWRFPHDVRQDVSQTIRVELTRAIPNFKGQSSLSFFIKRVCIKRCIDQVRRQVRQLQRFVSATVTDGEGEEGRLDFPAGQEADPVRSVILSERAHILRRLVDALGDTCRTAIRQFYLEGLSYKEIAEKNGINIHTVSSRLSKCMEKLRAEVRKNGELQEDFPA
jgi:RNA polymerase sigma-70 factor (ECF subfamily)